jgi:hypothetical protein
MLASTSSRNDLFSASWVPSPPPKPLPTPPLQPEITSKTDSPRTSSFFDTPPLPAPRLPALNSPSPLNLSRSSSLRSRVKPPPDLDRPIRRNLPPSEPLSPLHQSPSLPPVLDWTPPAPPSSEDVSFRLIPGSSYLLGEGRYAGVYLASYQDRRRAEDWKLCAAKRMASDRQSQTMGLREAFFLNRVAGNSVYIVKLIAVKEDGPGRPTQRQRSSTLRDNSPLTSFPSLPTLTHRTEPTPAMSRLVLLLEHAPLGTMDRLIRTSPDLVDKHLWERWAKQGTDALTWVHAKGIVHADVKPGNLLVRPHVSPSAD